MGHRPSISAHKVFKALGHPARLTIVRELADGERCVCRLVDAVGLGWSTVSRHLSVLREAGVVSDERKGLQVFYRLELSCVERFLDCLERPHRPPAISPATAACETATRS